MGNNSNLITISTDYFQLSGTASQLRDLTDQQAEIARASRRGEDTIAQKHNLENLALAQLRGREDFEAALAREERIYSRIQEVHTVLATGKARGFEGLTWMLLRSTRYRRLTEAQLCCLVYGTSKTKLPKRARRAMQKPAGGIDSVGFSHGEPGPTFESQDRLAPPETAGVSEDLLALEFLHWELPISGLRWAAYTKPNGRGLTPPTPGALGDILDSNAVERRHRGGLAYYRLAQ